MIQLQNLSHIFFDLDDTLWDFEKNSTNVLQKIYTHQNLQNKLGVDFNTFFLTYKKKNNDLWQLYNSKKITKDDLRKRRFYETFLLFGLDDFDMSWFVSEAYIQQSPYGKALKKGTLALLDKLSKQYQLHIITNGFSEIQAIKLQQCGLTNYFKNVIISEEVGFNKPDVRIFREAERLTNSNHQHCLMIGDNFNTDITGAKNAGWQSVWFNANGNKRYQATQVNCLTELMQVL